MRAGGGKFAILQFAFFRFGLNLGRLDALHAEGALLHDADTAHGNIGVELQVQRLVPLRVIEIEETHVVGAGIGAKTRADTTVIGLPIQSFLRVIAGIGGADRLAGSVVALLAQDGLKTERGLGKSPSQ